MVQSFLHMTRTAQTEPVTGAPPAESAAPIRVFLWSEDRLLPEMIRATLSKQPNMLFVGAHGLSLHTTSRIVTSACDVLLVDPGIDVGTVEAQLVLAKTTHELKNMSFVMMNTHGGISEMLSEIQSTVTRSRARFGPTRQGF